MPIRARKVVRLGPLRLNFTQSGFTSWSIKVGPWSWNSRTQRNSVDLPGPFRWQQASRPRRAPRGES